MTSKQKTKVVVTPPPTTKKGRPKGAKNKQPSAKNKQSPPKNNQPPATNKQPPAKRRKLNDDENATTSRSPSSCNVNEGSSSAFTSGQNNLFEEVAPIEAETEKRKAGRPKGKTHINSAAATMKPPGDPTYPLVAYSLTVTKNNGDISDQLLPIIQEFVEKYCERGIISTEVGKRVFRLHIQGLVELYYPGKYSTLLGKFIKKMIPFNGKGHKVTIKPLAKGQQFVGMIGYVTKDYRKPHYKVFSKGISAQDLTNGRRDHESLVRTFDESKKIINQKNLFNEAYRFNCRCLLPAVVPVHYVVLYMIQSKDYIFAPDIVSYNKKLDFTETEILWQVCHFPSTVTIGMILKLLFDPRSYGYKVLYILQPIKLL